jgi:hypothetical protein
MHFYIIILEGTAEEAGTQEWDRVTACRITVALAQPGKV